MTNLAAPHMDLDESHARFRAQLFQWREVHAAAHIYALLDPNHPVAPHDQLHPSGLTKREVTRHIESVVRPDLAHELALLPKLVQLYVAGESGYADEPMLDLTLRSAATRCRSVNGAYVAGWMCSEASPATAAEYLARSGTMFDLSKGRQRYLPIFEPYRMALLADDPQAESFLQRWLGPFIHWMFIDSCGTVRTVSRHADSTTSGGAAGLDRTQFEAQERIATARLVVMAIAQSGISIASHSERRIDEVMVQAARAGLRDTEDVIFYALNAFTLGAAWALHPRAAAVIQQVASQSELSKRLGAAS